jgi:hypothetical protein
LAALSVLILALGIAGHAWAVERTRSTRTPAKPRTQQSISEAELNAPTDSLLGDDHQKNLEMLQREKLEAVRGRVEILTRAMQMGKATQTQLDHATLEQLQAELDTLDRPAQRVQTWKKIIELRQKFEEEAKQGLAAPRGKPGDPTAWLNAHARYTSTKLARINAQMALEREQLAAQAETAKPDAPAEKAK